MTSWIFKFRFQSWTVLLAGFFVLQMLPILALNLGVDPKQALLLSFLCVLVTLPTVLFGFRSMNRTIDTLAEDTRLIRDLDFSGRLPQESVFFEVDSLSRNHAEMKAALQRQTRTLQETQHKLSSLVENGLLLSSERDRTALLRHILLEGKRICNADAATMYLKTEHDSLRFALRSMDDALPSFEIPLHDPLSGAPNEKHVSTYVALHNEAVLIDDVYGETRFDLSGTRHYDSESGYRTVSMLAVPLAPRQGEVIGVLQFMNAIDPQSGDVIAFPRQVLSFVEALASQSAMALENHNLIDAQKVLIDSMIEILAGAIDAKSPYTGGHCERVPDLAIMLAEEACKVSEGPLADFNFASADEWREFRIGAWLHDCSKITTPEHVVDKATKLETLYDRIHEVRMRFEVLKRDAWVAYWRGRAEGAEESALAALRDQLLSDLDDEFTFIARINLGGEAMADDDQARLKQIAERRWLRTLDNRLGVSWEEAKRLEHSAPSSLPVEEPLLADRLDHLIERADQEVIAPENPWGFKLEVPPYKFNRGELHNLSIARGTLTAEERYIINHHIVQTILMLDRLPFPKHLQNVTEIAGGHHEKMDGTGYPKRLTREQMSLPARMMAVADIFEALTAVDRPYKKGKTLSEALNIMAGMCKGAHIDPQLFALFIRAGIYRRYAERFMQAEQIDQVDEQMVLEKAGVL